MDPLEKIEKLAAIARRENPPLMFVNMQGILPARPRERVAVKPMAWMAGISAAAAALLLVATLHLTTSSANAGTSTQTDSVTSVFKVTQLEMP
jgi:hypothetical protein